jgi:hypothetical protein
VKADAYGHGATRAGRVFVGEGAWGLAVSLLEEGIQLREAGIDAPIVVLGGIYPGYEDLALLHRLSPVVWEAEQIERLAAAVRRSGRRGATSDVHLKVDTGMGRLGVLPEDLGAVLDAWRQVQGNDGKLTIGGEPAVHVGNGLFQTKGAAAPDLVITRTDEGIELYHGLGAERRLPDWQVAATVTFLIALVTVLLVDLVFMPFWIWGILTGRLAGRGGLSIRLVPALAMMTLVAGCLTLILILGLNDIEILGKPSTGGWLLFGMTFAVPALGAATLVRSAMGAPDANLFVRLLAWANGLIVVTAAGHLWAYGWIGMKIWE